MLTLTFNTRRAMVMTHTHAIGNYSGNRQTDRGNCIISSVKAVGKEKRSILRKQSSGKQTV